MSITCILRAALSVDRFFGIKSVRFHRTSLLYYMSITKYIIEHLKI